MYTCTGPEYNTPGSVTDDKVNTESVTPVEGGVGPTRGIELEE